MKSWRAFRRRRDVLCPSCGTAMGRRDLACPAGCGYDRRSERGARGSAWERIDRR